MIELFAEYGMRALVFVATVLGGFLTRYVWVLIKNATARAILERGYGETRDAVLEVAQTYVDELRKGREDGSLTPEEKANALAKAVAAAKANLGRKGLARLGRVLGVDVDSWLQSKVEATVKAIKLADAPPAAAAPAGGTTLAPASGVIPPIPRRPA